MPRSSFAKLVRNRREELPEGVRPWMAEAQPQAKKKTTKKRAAAKKS